MVTRVHKGRRGPLFIEEWMQHRGISDEKLANRIGVARETVTRWRSQQHRLNPGKITKIASALNLEPLDLWRLPSGRPSLDAMLRGAPDELQDTAADIVRRLLRHA